MISKVKMGELLEPSYFLEEDVVYMARDLLGKEILTNIDGQVCRARITETEAYRAPDDKACHAYSNRRTSRTETMFSEGGTAYIYLCYGIHHLFNVVTGPADMAHAVLIRAVEPLDNIDLMLQRRGMKKVTPALTAGPGRWTQAMGITTSLDSIKLYSPDSPIQLYAGEGITEDEKIATSTRIGVDYAGDCALRPWRFFIEKNRWVSRHR